MDLTFDTVAPGDVLTFINTHSNGGARTRSTHTARVTKKTERTVFLDDVHDTQDGIDGPRPVRYRLTRKTWADRRVRRTTAEGLPRRGRTATSRVADAALRPATPTVHTVVTVTTQGGPTRVHTAGCGYIDRDALKWHSTPRTHQVVDRAGLIRPMVEDLLAEDPGLDLDYFDNDEDFLYAACCPRLPWRALGACFGHQPRDSDNPRVQKVVAALTAEGHTPATVVGDYDDPEAQVQANGFLAYSRDSEQVHIAHLRDGHDVNPTTRTFHHQTLAAYAATLSGHDGITVLARPLRILRTRVLPTT